MLKHAFYNLMSGSHRESGLRQLQTLERKLLSKDVRFAVPFAYRGKGFFKTIEPRQNPEEIEALYKAVLELSPRRILEIGTARGGSLYLWIQTASEDATIVSIDLPGGKFGGAYPACRVPFYQSFARSGQTLKLLRRDSHQAETLSEVGRIFCDKPIDFTFIDGDHTYEGVKADFQDYGPLVRPGGLIGFHDILPRPDLPEIQVDRFWKELRDKYDCEELIGSEGSGRKIGIGLIHVGNNGLLF
ncbi:MAG: class I SAM-dependent methyltransferase [Acidobacteriota bacterium]|nr:class I SAM-dependent methyltransferase [Acidobacteriota bacterium]